MTVGRLFAGALSGLRLLLQALSLVFGALFVALVGGCLFIAGRSGVLQRPEGR